MIEEKKREILKHMLGADSRYKKSEWGFRNHFTVSQGREEFSALILMKDEGLVVGGKRFDEHVFWATEKGARHIGFNTKMVNRTKLAKGGEG